MAASRAGLPARRGSETGPAVIDLKRRRRSAGPLCGGDSGVLWGVYRPSFGTQLGLNEKFPSGLGSAFWQSPNEAWASVRCASNPWARSVEPASRPFVRGTARVRPQSCHVFKRSTALRLRFRSRTGSESHPRLDHAAPDCLRYACYPRQAAGKPPRLIWSTTLPATSLTGSPVCMNQESQLAFQSGITSGLSPNSVRRT